MWPIIKKIKDVKKNPDSAKVGVTLKASDKFGFQANLI